MPRFEDTAGTYDIVFSLHDRANALTADERAIALSVILEGHNVRYLLYGAAAMRDHIHLILQARNSESAVPLPPIMQWIKGVSSRRINLNRNSSGSLWEERYYNKLMRNEAHYCRTMEYLIDNPKHHEHIDRPDDYPYLWYLGKESVEDRIKILGSVAGS